MKQLFQNCEESVCLILTWTYNITTDEKNRCYIFVLYQQASSGLSIACVKYDILTNTEQQE